MTLRSLVIVAVAVVPVAVSRGAAQPLASKLVNGTAAALGRDGGCTAVATKALIRTFVTGYSSGRVAVIDRLWAPEPRFQWFSTSSPGVRLGASAYERATLAAYFRSRVRMHERIRLIELHAGYDAQRQIVNFSGKLVRSADDLRSKRHDFKGAADCESGHPTLIVWSM